MTDLTDAERGEFIEQLQAFAAWPAPDVMEFAPALELHRVAGLALEQIAAAWDEGFADGKRQDAEGDDGPRFTNPYRAEGSPS